MKNITSCLLIAFLSFVTFQRGSSSYMNLNEVRVGLYYNYDFGGHATEILPVWNYRNNNWFIAIPDWMQPYGERPLPVGLQFFIRTDTPQHFEARLHATNHVQLLRYTSIPEIAKVRLGAHIYKTVGEFSFYNPIYNSTLGLPRDPTTNEIYVFILPHGPTYSAPIVRESMEASSSSSH